MHILYLTGREIGYTRNDVLLRAFRRLGSVDVVAGSTGGGILARSLKVFLRALPGLRSAQYDLVFVGFFGQLLMVPVGRLALAPIVFDAFISTYDTLVEDRRHFSSGSLPGRLAFQLDRTGCLHARTVLLDTPLHQKYFVDTFHLPLEKFQVLPVGCNEDIFFPRPARASETLQVLFYSTYLPLHGADVIVRAADRLKGIPGIRFKLIGRGREYDRVRGLADELGTDNVSFQPPVALEVLASEIAASDICIGGHLGASQKAGRVVPGKIYQMLAMEKPVVAGDTPANRCFLTHRESAFLCPTGDPERLADAIKELSKGPELRGAIAKGGRVLYENESSERVITRNLGEIVRTAIE